MSLEELAQKLQNCEKHIFRIKNPQHRRDCAKMAGAARDRVAYVSTAQIECRRLKKETVQYREALEKACQSIQDLERYIMMAQLIS
jgi:phenylalanyl-tRNA synthetase beta subunit